MIQYRSVAFRPHVPSPTLGTVSQKELSQTFDGYLSFPPAMGDVIRLTFHSIATYLGIWVGLNAKRIKTGNKTQKTITVALAWALAGGQGIGAILDVVSLAQRIAGTHPPEPSATPAAPVIAPTPPVR